MSIRDLLLVIASLGFAISCAAKESAPVKPEPIFREISLGSYGSLALGRSMSADLTPVAKPVVTGLFALSPSVGRFGDTDSLLVSTGAANQVTAIRFVYLGGKDYQRALTDYQRTLGVPALELLDDSAGTTSERATWSDSATVFRLIRLTRDGRRSVYSELLDRRSASLH